MEQALLTPARPWSQTLAALDIAELNLCYFPRLALTRSQVREIEADFRGGVWIWTNPNQADVFRLGGSQFELRVVRVRSHSSGEWVASIISVDPAVSVPRKADRIAPRKVSIEMIAYSGSCDPNELLEQARRHGRKAAADHRRGLRGQEDVREHGGLQKDVLRQYGELRSLIDIMAQRPEEAELTVTGTVLEAGERGRRRFATLAVAVASGGDDLRYKRVQLVRGNGELFITRTLKNSGNVVEIVEPEGWSAAQGEQVRVELVKPFGMRQNAVALGDFLSGDIEGSWEDLARLLCRVGSLTPPERFDPPDFFYCDTDQDSRVALLDSDQRAAVIGALCSPHAYFIQGPPGTGKSEVICETVRQLVARGERVLFLAPSHVAVDEVLTRVGAKPGVRAYRITHDDEKVADQAHGYLLANLGVEFAERVLRGRGGDRSAQWQAEAARVRQQLAAQQLYQQRRERFEEADAALRRAKRKLAAVEAELAQHADTALAEETRLRQVTDGLAAELAEAATLQSQTGDRHAALRAEVAETLPNVRTMAAELVRAIDNAAEAWSVRVSADAQHAEWEAAFGERDRKLKSAQKRAAKKLEKAGATHAQAVRWAEHLAEQLRSAEAQQGLLSRLGDFFGVGEIARQRYELAEAQEQQRLWQEVARQAWDTAKAAEGELARWNTQSAAKGSRLSRERDAAAAATAATDEHRDSAFHAFIAAVAKAQLSTRRFETWHEYRRLASNVERSIGNVWDEHTTASPTLTKIGRLDNQLRSLAEAKMAERNAATAHAEVEQRHQDATQQAITARVRNEAQHERLVQRLTGMQAEAKAWTQAVAQASSQLDTATRAITEPMTPQREEWLGRRQHVLEHLSNLESTWGSLMAERLDEQQVEDIRISLVRATNLVCATTRGIVGRGSELVRHTDYDTLIVDEASRVTESEFLIGAVKARRWVLVGDEHQLPPHVDQKDEFFLHALTALHRVERGASPSLREAVEELAAHWAQQEDSHKFRIESVIEVATSLEKSELWSSSFRGRFTEAHSRFVQARRPEQDPDLALLAAMLRYLVQSLFQRAVGRCPPALRQPLRWQRRMIEPLARIVNEPIYDGRYLTAPPEELVRLGVTPLVTTGTLSRPAIFFDTSQYRDAHETEAGHGFTNRREQDVIADLCQMYEQQLRAEPGAKPVSVSVLAFYRAQARALRDRLRAMDSQMLQWRVIDVIDRIQGQQADLVIISFTRATAKAVGPRYGQWLKDVRRLNVACTRARRGLVLVGHGKTLRQMAKMRENRVTPANRFYQNLFELVEDDSVFLRMYST